MCRAPSSVWPLNVVRLRGLSYIASFEAPTFYERGFFVSIQAAVTVLIALTLSRPALAADVFLNNTKVTGSVKQLALPKVDVRFDDVGNVYIDAPGYLVEVAAPPPPPAPSGKYYLVVNVPAPGHYAIEVNANGKAVASIPAGSPNYFAELSDKLQTGANGILFTFLPVVDAPAVQETDAIDILVGRGEQTPDGTLTITRVLGTLKRKTGTRLAEAQMVNFELTP